MRSLLPFLFVMACPIMMIFMMRGMHGGHGTSKLGPDVRRTHSEAGTPDGQASDARIAELEREVAQIRTLQAQQSEPAPVRRP